jgi:hypothetical protein
VQNLLRREVFHEEVVSEPNLQFFFFCREQIETMPPKRREIRMPDPTMERERRELCARLYAMERTQRWKVDVGDLIEVETKNEAGAEEEVVAEDAVEECLFRVVARIGAREKMEILMYEGNLDIEELLDSFGALDKYFDSEDV